MMGAALRAWLGNSSSSRHSTAICVLGTWTRTEHSVRSRSMPRRTKERSAQGPQPSHVRIQRTRDETFVQFRHFLIELGIDVVLAGLQSGDRNRTFMMREIRSRKVGQESNPCTNPASRKIPLSFHPAATPRHAQGNDCQPCSEDANSSRVGRLVAPTENLGSV